MDHAAVTNDILNNPRFEGAIESISKVTQFTDIGFGIAITFVAFVIILVAMFKNVLAAAYCAYPKFWDHVHESHDAKKDTNFIQQTIDLAKGMGQSGGIGKVNEQSIGMIVMGILPDIKAMTDFNDSTISAKTYFMKAIPQMIVCVCLGAFIYNGSYRDVASLFVDTGTELLNRTLLEWDPIAMFDQITGSAGRPVFTSDNGVDQFTQAQNKIATNLYTACIGTYKDITTAEQKRALADSCDTIAASIVSNIRSENWGGQVLSAQGDSENRPFEMKFRCNWSTTDIDVSSMKGKVSENPTVYQYAEVVSLSKLGISAISSESHPENVYIACVMQFTEGVKEVTGGGAPDLTLYLGNSANGNTTYYVSSASGKPVYFNSNPGTIVLSDGTQLEFKYQTGGSRDGTLTWNRHDNMGQKEFDVNIPIYTLINGKPYKCVINKVKFDGRAGELESLTDTSFHTTLNASTELTATYKPAKAQDTTGAQETNPDTPK